VNAQPIAIVSLEWDVVDLIESCGGLSIAGFFDPHPTGATGDYPILGADSAWMDVRARIPDLKIALAIDGPKIRSELFDRYGAASIATVRSPHAYVSKRARVGHGCLIQRGVTIMPGVTLGRACKINVNGTIHHETSLGDFCTVAPGAQILGNVRIGDRVYIGAGAIVRQRCSIGADTVIGAGAVVVEDVPANVVVVGVPARRRSP
jgi:sugar O-acyltransferase (sialic acid O-acetyltransferase NeuD family)